VKFADAGSQGIEKRPVMEGMEATVRTAMRPDSRRSLPEKCDGRFEA
jgi:hypothetical protein